MSIGRRCTICIVGMLPFVAVSASCTNKAILERPSATSRAEAAAAPSPAPATTATPTATATPAAKTSAVETFSVEVLSEIPRQEGAFTQGLELSNGGLYESTGLLGRSSIQELDPTTGTVRRRVELPRDFFGEGITAVGERLFQLTWKNGLAIVYDRATLTELQRFSNPREGWGICYDGKRLVLSDGTNRLTFRDAETFAELGGVDVSKAGMALNLLNELECVDGKIFANVWKTTSIVAIDPTSGQVTAQIDASRLVPPGTTNTDDVLNGIASVGNGRFIVTGKRWPSLFVVSLTRQ